MVAGCGRSFLQFADRAPWRQQAEETCLRSGAVKITPAVKQMDPIDGPGVCGAAYPLKVAALGDIAALGYGDDLRPPGSIPNASSAQMPRWPAASPSYAAPPRPIESAPVAAQPVRAVPANNPPMRWMTGPPAIDPVQATGPAGAPMSITPPGAAEPDDDDIPDDAELPASRAPQRAQDAYNAPVYQPPPQRTQPRELPRLGPARPSTAAPPAAVLTPAATLACPIVSALDRWVSGGVQPAALHWFGSPVVEIKQISAYACRGMVGSGTRHISEHAFGNALDIAGFTLADGRKISVKDGWRGTPEEQGFLHDVQLYACQTFNTVLAPGYNAAHYNHIHVDLMRRSSGRKPCRPNAIPGEVVAAKARAVYASRQGGRRDVTGSIAKPGKPVTLGGMIQEALAGEDGFVADEDGDEVTGSIAEPAEPAKPSGGGLFSRWFGGGSAAKTPASLEDRLSNNY
ncbi:MAG: extensin family protein [Pseudolabrys sp.]